MNFCRCFIFLQFVGCISVVSSEFITLTGWLAGSAVFGSGLYNWKTVKDKTYCRFTECCNSDYVKFDLDNLKRSFKEHLFGQPLAYELVNILGAHKDTLDNSKRPNNKALVISLHGWSGVGKNYVSSMIANSIYAKGIESKFVKLFMGKKDFDCSDLEQSKKLLMEQVNAVVTKCSKALIIFDEIHDMCPNVLDAIKPMLDHYHAVDGIDYRDSIFVFISNIGGHEIASNLLSLYEQGVKRNEVEFNSFEPILRRTAYHTGGFTKSSTISQSLIDHYIPFLPLEQQHVEMCALAEFRAQGVLTPTEEMMSDALSVITYGPTEAQPIFANNGCKRFSKYVPYVIKKYRYKPEKEL